jgi:integrase
VSAGRSRCRLCPDDDTLRLGEGVSVAWAPSEATHLVVWRTPDGRRRKKRVREHRQAIAVAQDVLDQLLAAPASSTPTAAPAVAGSRSVSVPELARAFVASAGPERGWSANYVRKQRRLIATYVDEHLDVPSATWDVADTLLLMDATTGRLGASSRKQLLSLLRQVGRFGVQRGIVHHDPTAGVEVTTPRRHRPTAVEPGGSPDELRYVTVDECPSTVMVERLAAAFVDDGHDPLPALLSAYSGLRFSEVFALEREDIDIEAGTIAVERQVDAHDHARDGTVMTPDGRARRYWHTRYGPAALPKGDKTRMALLPHHLVDEVAARPPGLLFPTDKGTYLRNQTWWNRKPFGRARLWAGWPIGPDGRFVWRWHSLRHHCASWCLTRGIPIQDVSEMLGHSQVETTLRMYVHTEAGAAARAAANTRGWRPPSA